MIIDKEEIKLRNISADIPEEELRIIKAYLQGAVYSWCKNNKDENGTPLWFAARDLFGGENYYWESTPLFQLYQWHENNDANDPVNMAGRDVGHLIKRILHEDDRRFLTRKSYTREYKWTVD